jgi:SAM-dependent methyltransferase
VTTHTGLAAPALEHPALAAYGQVLVEGGRLWLCHDDGSVEYQDTHRWVADADAVDRRMLARCGGPTIDVGCGPGRLVAALAAAGTPALGIDLSAHAVTLARVRGALVLRRDVFGPLPGEGRWACVLLADGNVGIGGEPRRLLRRIAALAAPDGRLVVEVARGDVDRRGPVRVITSAGVVSRPFRWAALGAPALLREAGAAGWRADEVWEDGGRRFVALSRAGGARRGGAATRR